jgi:hypothetical protein
MPGTFLKASRENVSMDILNYMKKAYKELGN